MSLHQCDVSLRCPVCGMDTADPEHRAWACEELQATISKRHDVGPRTLDGVEEMRQ